MSVNNIYCGQEFSKTIHIVFYENFKAFVMFSWLVSYALVTKDVSIMININTINAAEVKPVKPNVLSYLKENSYFIISFFALLAGMLFGALSVRLLGAKYLSTIEEFIKGYISFRVSSGFFKVFSKVFLTGAVFIAVIILSGFGVSGLPVIPITVFLRGFGTCALAGVLYRDYSLKGIAFADLILLPSCIVTDFIIIYAAGRSLALSFKFCELVKDLSSRGISVRPQCIDLLKTCLRCTVIMVLSSLVEAAFSCCFIKYFSF